MAALDGSRNELYVSPQIEAMLGFSQKEWLEDPILWFSQLHPDDQLRWHEEFAATCATGKPFSAEYRFLSRAGQIVWVHGDAKLVCDDDGQPLFLHGIAFDITAHKQAEETLLRAQEALEEQVRLKTAKLSQANDALRAEMAEHARAEARVREQATLLDLATDAILVHDLQGRITFWNRGAELLYGWPAAEAMGSMVEDLSLPSFMPQAESARSLTERGEWSGELRQTVRDGRKSWSPAAGPWFPTTRDGPNRSWSSIPTSRRRRNSRRSSIAPSAWKASAPSLEGSPTTSTTCSPRC